MSQTGFEGASQLLTDEGATFEILGELGRGGMGVVYRAFDERIGRAVALKVGLVSDTPARLARFRREGEIAASLEHPGIVRVHSAGAIRGRPYLCFELVEDAATLSDRFVGFPLETRLRLLVELGEALGYAHARGVVHRDVKPENVLVDVAGNARLTDFGVARAADQDRLTGTGTALGTPFFAAPEQLRDGHRVGPQADVWSLGVILYQALTGELPFQGDSLLTLVAKINAGFFDPPRVLSKSVSPYLEAVCLAALKVQPEERYPSGAEFAADLGRAIRGEAPLALARRGKSRLVSALAAALLALGVLGGWAASQATGDPDGGTPTPTSTPGVASGWQEAAETA
ncbi:MAG: serine/threonine protein kinase, partial [Planctomycetes bacterium]|nr:serine/threonine protein kinase [Planctomycetota bacterium]